MGCILPLTSYHDSYDHAVIAAVNRKFGRDVFKEVEDQSSNDWQEKHKADLKDVSRSE